MKAKIFTFLLTLAMTIPIAVGEELVPALIVYGTDGGQQEILLDGMSISELTVLQSGKSMEVTIPSKTASNIRSFRLGMVETSTNDIEEITSMTNPHRYTAEKFVQDGRVYIRVNEGKKEVFIYDVTGNKLSSTHQ